MSQKIRKFEYRAEKKKKKSLSAQLHAHGLLMDESHVLPVPLKCSELRRQRRVGHDRRPVVVRVEDVVEGRHVVRVATRLPLRIENLS